MFGGVADGSTCLPTSNSRLSFRQYRHRLPATLVVRFQVSKEAVAAVTHLTLSLKRAVASPPSPVSSRTRSLSWGMEDSIAHPRVLSPPWGIQVESKNTIDTSNRRWGADQATSSRSTASSTTAAPGVVNNWSTAIPLPRLALLSGLTTLRLNVSLAGVQARIPSRGLIDIDDDDNGDVDDGISHGNTARNGPSAQEASPPASPRKSGGHSSSSARAERARRCIRRVARQLVDRIHPAATSAGYQQACGLFRDEMGALGYDRSVLNGVVQALLDSAARIRGLAGHDSSGGKDGQEAFQPHSGMPASPPLGAAAGLQQETTTLPEERDDVRELVEAGMAALPSMPVSESGGACGGNAGVGQKPLLLDIASVEVGCWAREKDAHVLLTGINPRKPGA